MSWGPIKLIDATLKIGSGSTPKGGKQVYIDQGVSFIRSQNVYNLQFSYDGLSHITNEAARKLDGVTVIENDILLNITGDSVARVCVVPSNVLPARVSQHVAIIRVNKDIFDAKFLCAYLASPYMQAFMLKLAVGKGASRNAMTKGMIENFMIPCPPLAEQRRIADILSAYDDLIENNQKQIKLLEEAAQRLYKEWFIDLHFPGWEHAKIVNGIPDGWKTGKAQDYFTITIGKTPPRAEAKWFALPPMGENWLSIADMGNNDVYIFATSESLTEEAIQRHHVKIVPMGSVLLSFKLTVGRVAIAGIPLCTNEAIAHFYITEDETREYLYCYLRNFNYDTLGSTSSISKAINSDIVKAMPMVIPEKYLLSQFADIVSPIFEQISAKQLVNNNLKSARDMFLPKLMNGELCHD